MSETITTTQPTGTWEWYFNYKNQCWDKVVQQEDGSYVAYQWNKTTQKWDEVKNLEGGDGYVFSSPREENHFCYWYSSGWQIITTGLTVNYVYDNPNKEVDASRLGQVWKWNGTNWARIDESSLQTGVETYIIGHGLLNSYSQGWIAEMAGALNNARPGAQILCVDWGDESKHAIPLAGDVTAANIDEAAARAAIMLSQLLGTYSEDCTLEKIGVSSSSSAKTGGVDVNLGGFAQNLTWIGHSFGAHLGAWFSEFTGRVIGTIVGLDSAEEDAILGQKNDIILSNNDIADNVFFYKSSSVWGGDGNLGHYSFVALQEGVSYITGLDKIRYTLFSDDHAYAYDFYTSSMSNSSGLSAGQPLTLLYSGSAVNPGIKYYEDLKALLSSWKKSGSNSGWIGVIDDLSGRIEGLTQGYTSWRKFDSKEVSWNCNDYKSCIEEVLKTVDTSSHWYNPFDNNKLDPNIIAVKYLTDYSFWDKDGNEEEISIKGAGIEQNSDGSYKLSTGETYNLSTTIYNYADNIAFGKKGKETLDAQEEMHSSWEVWLSTNEEKLDREKSVKLSSENLKITPTNLDSAGGKTKATQVGQTEANTKFSISEKQLEELFNYDSSLRDRYNAGEEITLYLYRCAGVDSKSEEHEYVAGELYSDDNESKATKVTLQKGVAVTFVIDVSGSMDGEIDALKNALTRYIEAVRDSGKDTKMRLITFRDYPGSQTVQLTTSDAGAMLNAVSGLSASGGIYPGEISLHALETAVQLAEKNSKIIMVTDEEAYPGVNTHNLLAQAADKNVQISASVVGFFPSLYGAVSSYSQPSVASASPLFASQTAGSAVSQSLAESSSDDSMEDAKEIVLSQRASGVVGWGYDADYNYYYDSEDWYKIELQKDTPYCLKFKSEYGYSSAYLYDEEGNYVTYLDAGECHTITTEETGVYYVKIDNSYNDFESYTLKINEQVEMEDLVEATINQTVSDTVHYVDDFCDWVKIDLQEHYLYSFNIQSENGTVYMNLFEDDGETEIAFLESGEGYTFSPDESGSYYMRVRATDFAETPYAINIKQLSEESELGTSLESFSIISAETGGNFVSMSYANYSTSHIHEALYYNFLMSIDNPVVMTCGPNAVCCGTTVTLTVNGSGTNWRAGQTNVSFSSENIKVLSVDVTSATSLQVTLEISDDCELNAYDISVTCGNEVAQGFSVLSVYSQPTDAQIVSVSSDCFERGKDFVVTIHGYDTNWSQDSVTVSLGAGANITKCEVVSKTEIKVYGSIAEDAGLGYRAVCVSGADTELYYSGALFITSTTLDAPAITQITPDSLEAGGVTELTIIGKNLDFTTSSFSIDLGEGIEILETTVVDAVTLKVKVSTDETLASGFRDVRLLIDGHLNVIKNGLDIVQKNDVPLEVPTITKVTPDILEAGGITELTIVGKDLDFTTSDFSLDMGEGIEILETTVIDAVTLKVKVSIDQTLVSGGRDIQLLVDGHLSVVQNGLDIVPYNDTPASAILLPLDSDNRVYRKDTLGDYDSVDYFCIAPKEAGAYRVSMNLNELDSPVKVSVGFLDNSGDFVLRHELILASGAGLGDLPSVSVAPDEKLYVKVEGVEKGNETYFYELNVTGSIPSSVDGRVTQNNSSDKATSIAADGQAISGWVGAGDACDFYSVQMEGNGRLHMALDELESSARMRLFRAREDGSLAQLDSRLVRSDSALDRTLSLTSGMYYIEISSSDGGLGCCNTTYQLTMEKEMEQRRENSTSTLASM